MRAPLKTIHVWTPGVDGSRGGIQRYSAALCEALCRVRPDADVRVFAKHDKDGGTGNRGRIEGCGHLPDRLRTGAFAAKLWNAARRDRPDLILITHPNFSPLAAYIQRRCGIPYAVAAHGVEVWSLPLNSRVAEGLACARSVLAVSRFTARRCRRLASAPAVKLLPNTVDAERFRILPRDQTVRAKYGIAGEAPLLLTVNRLSAEESWRGYERTLEAMPRILRHHPGVHWLVAGDGSARSAFQQRIDAAGLSRHITLAGFVPDDEMPALYGAADLFVMPSRLEGFGIVYLESMACGVPCVGGREDGAADALADGKLGRLVDPDDTVELAGEVCEVLARPDQLMRGETLRRAMLRRFGPERFRRRLDRILRGFEQPSGVRSCHVVASLARVTGGPARSVPALADGLCAAGGDAIVAARRNPQLGRENRPALAALRSQPVSSLSRRARGFGGCWRVVRAAAASADIVHSHGLWMGPNTHARKAAKAIGRPLVISPRGMLEEWSLERAGAKKRIALALYEKKNLRAAAAFHATSPEEAESVRRAGLRQPVAVVPNGVRIPPENELPPRSELDVAFPALAGKRVALFLSRIHPKKGLDLLLPAWKSAAPDPDWRLLIAGPGERSEIDRLVDLRAELRLGDQVIISGAIHDQIKLAALRHAAFLVLPTYSENFGIVVAEALACGTPVITTTGTPWRGLDTRGCGTCIEPEAEALQMALHDFLKRPPHDLRAMGERGRAWMQADFSEEQCAAQMHAFYLWLLGRGPRPGCVRED